MKKLLFILLLIINYSLMAQPVDLKKLYNELHIYFKIDSDWIEQLNKFGILSQPLDSLPVQNSDKPLMKKFPQLVNVPFVNLCMTPTPINRLTSIDAAAIFIKEDGQSAYPYGGNKPRKLQFELGAAVAHGAKTIITFGCAGSNHAVAVSEQAAKFGLKTICMLKPQANSSVVRKNLLLHLTNGTELHYYPDNLSRNIGTLEKWSDYKNTYGDYPYIIPTGGSTPLGTIGFVDAAFELKEQIENGQMPAPDYIYVPCGSCATTAGLLLGCKVAGLRSKIIAIATEPEDEKGAVKNKINSLFTAANQLLRSYDQSFPLVELTDNDFMIDFNFTGPEYGVFTQEGMHARRFLKEKENIIIEGTYTAKAFAALLEDLRTKKINGTVLFWNTYCGNDFEERLKNADYKKLPACFHSYFEDEIQVLDRLF